MFVDQKNFYPTPEALAIRMAEKVKNKNPKCVLEPSAGKGDLIDGMFPVSYYRSRPNIACIEIDPNLQSILTGRGLRVIDTDFLAYCGHDKFDLIVGNPPFDSGDKHLLKAIEIMFCGEIVFLLNAETLKNPYTNSRQILVQKLNDLGADVEFIQGAFANAERPTGVEVALVHVEIDRSIESGLVDGLTPGEDYSGRVDDKFELSTGKTIAELVSTYNETVNLCIEQAVSFFRNYSKIGGYLGLAVRGAQTERYPNLSLPAKERTAKLQEMVNDVLRDIRIEFWRKVLNLKEVNSRLTEKRREEFDHALSTQSQMDFTEANIRQFVLNVIGSYEQTLRTAVGEIFSRLTIDHCWRGGLNEKNIHYFNGWKTNDAFKVGKKVILPVYGSYGGAFFDKDFGRWMLNYAAEKSLHDIDIVMNYFDGLSSYISLADAIKRAFARHEHSGSSTYFDFKCHKKGTIHLEFRDENILRRFNVVACQGRGWLPEDYGTKGYAQLDADEKHLADAFEGKASYCDNQGKPLFAESATLRLAA